MKPILFLILRKMSSLEVIVIWTLSFLWLGVCLIPKYRTLIMVTVYAQWIICATMKLWSLVGWRFKWVLVASVSEKNLLYSNFPLPIIGVFTFFTDAILQVVFSKLMIFTIFILLHHNFENVKILGCEKNQSNKGVLDTIIFYFL